MPDINDLLEACSELEERLEAAGTSRDEIIQKHLTQIEAKLKFTIPDFETGLEWLNVSSPLSFSKELKGKVVVLDFFTYCCVNCMHVLPDLEVLEEKFSIVQGVAIVGVHSAKFENEKISSNILSAVLRYNILHPVVNDSEAKLWNELMIACWPTFVIVGPAGQFLYTIVGEGHRDKLIEFVSAAVKFYVNRGEISGHQLPVKLARDELSTAALRFPGKVCLSVDGFQLVIADTGHHRILVVDKNGLVQHVIGGSERGLKDGGFTECQFSSPQGVAMLGSNIFVADTDNHAIRKIDLKTQTVSTLAGTGKQGTDFQGGNTGVEQELSSPWDLVIGGSPGNSDPKVLYVAMAGSHQIWVYFIQDTVWYKNREYKAGTCIRFAGSGIEENKNNSYPEKAGFAQPSGLALSSRAGLDCLYIADSESSSVRQIQLSEGAVKGLVGGDMNPKNLFAYGDEDGVWTKAKLQHPLGVALVNDEVGPLLVADSYNHKIKTVDVRSKECCTILGTGKPGSNKGDNLLETELNEPGGISVNQEKKIAYIADTNNHDIKVLELDTQKIYSLPVIFPTAEEQASSRCDELQSGSGDTVSGVNVYLSLEFKTGVYLNEEARSKWQLLSEDETGKEFLEPGKCKGDVERRRPLQKLTTIPLSAIGQTGQTGLHLVLDLIVCEQEGLICRMEKQTVTQSVDLSVMSENSELRFDVMVE